MGKSSDHLYRRGKIWWCWVYESNRTVRRISTGCTDQEAARRFLREAERNALDPVAGARSTTTLKDVLDLALAYVVGKATGREARRSLATVEFYRNKVKQLLKGFPEPFLQARALAEVARAVRSVGLSVFVFTGYELEELTRHEQRSLLALADVVVSGRYVEAVRTANLPWRGSANQRVHFLTSRYGPSNMVGAASIEVHLHADGETVVTGFPIDVTVSDLAPRRAP